MSTLVRSDRDSSKTHKSRSKKSEKPEKKKAPIAVRAPIEPPDELIDILARVDDIASELSAKYKGKKMIDVETEEVKDLVTESCGLYSALHADGTLEDPDVKRRLENAMQMLYYLEQAMSASAIASRLVSAGALNRREHYKLARPCISA